MKLSEFIRQAEQFKASMPQGCDPELVLYDREMQRELRTNPDQDVWDFELTRGDEEIVVEFTS